MLLRFLYGEKKALFLIAVIAFSTKALIAESWYMVVSAGGCLRNLTFTENVSGSLLGYTASRNYTHPSVSRAGIEAQFAIGFENFWSENFFWALEGGMGWESSRPKSVYEDHRVRREVRTGQPLKILAHGKLGYYFSWGVPYMILGCEMGYVSFDHSYDDKVIRGHYSHNKGAFAWAGVVGCGFQQEISWGRLLCEYRYAMPMGRASVSFKDPDDHTVKQSYKSSAHRVSVGLSFML